MKKTVLFIAALLLGMATMVAKVTPAPIFADDMVLQQQTEVSLWGTAKPDAKVVITTTWSKAKTVVNTDADGKWKASVSTPVAGGPYEITFNDGEKLTIKNVLIGEVWFCSFAQSRTSTAVIVMQPVTPRDADLKEVFPTTFSITFVTTLVMSMVANLFA